MSDPQVRLRLATIADLPFLWSMLAAAVTADPPWTVEQAQSTPAIAQYLDGWPRPGDRGVVGVLHDAPGHDDHRHPDPVGAAWYRQFPVDNPGYGWVAADVPELSIAVVPEARGRGIGAALLGALLHEAATQGVERLSLSVDPTNLVAIRLYRRLGFQPIGNTDGASSRTMLARIDQ